MDGSEEIACDVCIVGAGIAGLNALFAASRYLSRDRRVVLVERRAAAGGMWLSAYGYVRLHQPHPLFTAGNIPWTGEHPPEYLAGRDEVVAHLQHCADVLRTRVTLDERFGYELRSHDEAGAGADEVLVECASVATGAPLRIRTKKLIKAFGYDIRPAKPLPVSSQRVRSVSPDLDDLCGDEMRESDAPVYVVGGGKTGMDTAHALITRFPGKKVHLLVGSGVMFGCRDRLYPSGLRRYFTGHTPIASFLDVTRRFDGRNEREVLDHYRDRYCIAVSPDARRFMFGLLSEAEKATIESGAAEVCRDYFVDVGDRDGRPTLVLASGETRAVPSGTWVVNCTGYLVRDDLPYEPFVSKSGKVVSIQTTSALHVLSTHAAYMAVHLAFLGTLQSLPLYELDLAGLHRKSRDALSATLAVHSLYNVSQMIHAFPRDVLDDFGADLERWFPAPRRMVDVLRLVHFLRRNPTQLRDALDVVRERFDVRCGPLSYA